MQRINDIYYTDQVFDGQVNQDGHQQPAPSYKQGESIQLFFFLQYNGVPVTEDNFILEVVVKKSLAADHILWKGELGSGLYRGLGGNPGLYNIILPASISSTLLPGSYYLEVSGVQPNGTGVIADLTVSLVSTMFSLELGASSPNPKIRNISHKEVVYNPQVGLTDTTVKGNEGTLPVGINVI